MTTLIDRTPQENHGVVTGATVGTDHTTFVAANSDNIRIPDSESLSPTSAMTAMVWVKGAVQLDKGILTHWEYGTPQRGYRIGTPDGGLYNHFLISLTDDGGWNDGHRKHYRSSIAVFDNTWHLIGATFDAGILKLFIDGVEDTNPTKMYDAAITTIHNSTANVMLGSILNSDNPVNFFNGDIAGAKIWNRALSEAEVLLLYEKSKGKFL